MQVDFRNVKFSLIACLNWLLEYLLLVMEIIAVLFLLWYPEDAPWYLVINKSTSASHLLLFQLPSSCSSPSGALALLFWLQGVFFPSNSLGLSSSAILCRGTAHNLCVDVCGSLVAPYLSECAVGALGLHQSVSPQNIPACLGHEGNSLINTDPVHRRFYKSKCFNLSFLQHKM